MSRIRPTNSPIPNIIIPTTIGTGVKAIQHREKRSHWLIVGGEGRTRLGARALAACLQNEINTWD